jgi:hypothetical protein
MRRTYFEMISLERLEFIHWHSKDIYWLILMKISNNDDKEPFSVIQGVSGVVQQNLLIPNWIYVPLNH